MEFIRLIKAKKIQAKSLSDFLKSVSPARVITKYLFAPEEKWFEEGDTAYIYIPLDQSNLIKNVSTKTINQDLNEEIENTNVQQVKVISIDEVKSGHESIGDVTPVSITVRLENGQLLEHIPVEWLSKEKKNNENINNVEEAEV